MPLSEHAMAANSCGCGHGCNVHGHAHAGAWGSTGTRRG